MKMAFIQKKIKLPEGIYWIKAESKDKFGKEIKKEEDIIAISYSSDKMSVKLPCFFEIISSNLKPGDTFKAFWATGYDQGPAYIEICHRNNVLKSYWTDPNKNKEFIYFPVTQEMRGGFYVKVFQVKENRFYETDRHINVSWSNKDLKLKLVHFTSNKIQMAGWSRLLWSDQRCCFPFLHWLHAKGYLRIRIRTSGSVGWSVSDRRCRNYVHVCTRIQFTFWIVRAQCRATAINSDKNTGLFSTPVFYTIIIFKLSLRWLAFFTFLKLLFSDQSNKNL